MTAASSSSSTTDVERNGQRIVYEPPALGWSNAHCILAIFAEREQETWNPRIEISICMGCQDFVPRVVRHEKFVNLER